VDNWRIITGDDGESQIHISTIKNAILNYGPVYSTIYANDAFMAYDNGVYEYWGSESPNHAIEIIGWDDSLPHSHGTGAWLIKNSWGTDWGRNSTYSGCGWVAYEAANLGDSTSAISGYKIPGDIIFYHDECGWMWYSTGCGTPTAYGAVRFIPSQDSTLTAVDFWAVDTNMGYEIKIFDTLNTYPTYYTFSNQLGTTQTGTINESGYYSIHLNTPVELVSGDDFIVQVKLTATTHTYPIPIDRADHISWLNWSSIATSSGESYASCGGSQFEKYGTGGIDIGIRARAEVEITQPDIWFSPTSFEKELSPDEVHSENLTIGNNGTDALKFEIWIDYLEQQATSAKTKTATFNINDNIHSDGMDEIENGTGIAFVKNDKNKLISLPLNNSGDLLSQIIVIDVTNYTLRPSEDKTVTDTPGNTKLYLRYINSSKPKVLRESKGSSTDVYSYYFLYYGETIQFDGYFLTGDISGTSYDFSLLASSDGGDTDFTLKIKVDGTTLATKSFNCDTELPYVDRYSYTITGIDPTTFNGDEMTLEITCYGPWAGDIYWNGGSGDASDWYSYITIPPATTEIHDMVVTNVYTTPSSPTTEQAATISVTVKNEGNQAESNVPVKAYVDDSQVDSTKYVSLSAGQSTTKSFSWTPSTAKTYSVKGEVGAVSGETDTADSTKIIDVYVSPKDWLSISSPTGTVNPSSQTNITVKFNTTGLSSDYRANINITSNDPDESVVTVPVHLIVRPEALVFDTDSPANPYPSILGTHNGTITPNQTINASKMFTYSCPGTGGHSEYVAFYNATTGDEIANGTWTGYQGAGDYHYIIFENAFMLKKDATYNYTVRTGSYPQIRHTSALPTANGWINCTEFTDANGKKYNNWIPAIRLE
jgi:hypothetical protein